MLPAGPLQAVFPNTTCNASICQADPANPSNKCCAGCTPERGIKSLAGLSAKHCAGGSLTNTTEFDVMYARDATPYTDGQGRHLYGFTTLPKTRKEAYEVFRNYYNTRVAWITSIGDQPYAPLARVNSITCVSHLEIYAALWNSQGPNLEHTAAAGASRTSRCAKTCAMRSSESRTPSRHHSGSRRRIPLSRLQMNLGSSTTTTPRNQC